MSKKCVHCGAPIEGFWAKISSVAGVKQSTKNPDYCNKCEGMIPSQPEATEAVQPQATPATQSPETSAEAERVELPPQDK